MNMSKSQIPIPQLFFFLCLSPSFLSFHKPLKATFLSVSRDGQLSQMPWLPSCDLQVAEGPRGLGMMP